MTNRLGRERAVSSFFFFFESKVSIASIFKSLRTARAFGSRSFRTLGARCWTSYSGTLKEELKREKRREQLIEKNKVIVVLLFLSRIFVSAPKVPLS